MKTTKVKPATDDLIAEDLAQAPATPADKLEAITTAAGQLLELEAMQARLNDEAGKVGAEIQRLTQQVLPGLMDEAQIRQLKLDDDSTLSRVDEVFASISKADANAAADWLVANGYGSIVKMGFQIPVDKGDVKLQKKIRALLRKAKIGYEELSSVHTQTLRAFARESVEVGRQLPPLIKVHVQPVVKLARKGNRGRA